MNTEIKKYIIYIKEHFFEIVDDILCFWANNKLYFLCTAIYFYISFCIFGGNFKSFILLLLIYTVSIIISFSPIGEKLLRLLNNVRPLETSKEKEYILPLFQEVFEQAKIKNKYLNKIEICIIDNMTVNVMALGKRTIAVTKGAINTFTEEQLKAVIGHEIAHIVNDNTTSGLYAMIGNGIFTVIILMYKLMLLLWEFMLKLFIGRRNILSFLIRIFRFILEIVIFILTFGFQIIIMKDSRKNEFIADKFSYDLGYDSDMIEALYLLENISLGDNSTIIQKMIASHPRITKRIEYLESFDEQGEYNYS